MWFVWIQGQKGPEPQKWDEGTAFDWSTGNEKATLLKIHIPGCDDRPLAELAKIYPLITPEGSLSVSNESTPLPYYLEQK